MMFIVLRWLHLYTCIYTLVTLIGIHCSVVGVIGWVRLLSVKYRWVLAAYCFQLVVFDSLLLVIYDTVHSVYHISLQDLTWHFYAAYWILSVASQMGIYSLPVTQNLVWHRLIKSHFGWHHTLQHCLGIFKLKKSAKCLNLTMHN